MAKQTDSPKHDCVKKNDSFFSTYNVIQQRAIHDRDSYAGRNTKLGYCPIHEMGSVIQMVKRCLNCGATSTQCSCGNYEEDDSDDATYCESTHEQYLNPAALRKGLGAAGLSGEAHHIIPGAIVKGLNLVKYLDKDMFNDPWNGIMLNGTRDENRTIIHKYKKYAPKILHRNAKALCHNAYSREIETFFEEYPVKNFFDIIQRARNIRNSIQDSKADCLDEIGTIRYDPNA